MRAGGRSTSAKGALPGISVMGGAWLFWGVPPMRLLTWALMVSVLAAYDRCGFCSCALAGRLRPQPCLMFDRPHLQGAQWGRLRDEAVPIELGLLLARGWLHVRGCGRLRSIRQGPDALPAVGRYSTRLGLLLRTHAKSIK
jgi:hypothetical protein